MIQFARAESCESPENEKHEITPKMKKKSIDFIKDNI